jgi:S-adenosylhomocysteine hydrolase
MLQALCLEHVARHHDSMQAGAQGVPRKIEEEIARRLLEALGVSR